MATKTIAWNTGSGNITLTYTGQGNGSISVASDENESFDERSQSVNIITTNGSPEKAVSVLIKQQGKKYAVGDVFNFDYTGNVQQITLPKGKYKLQCWGAQGGSVTGSYAATGSKGGYSEGVLTLTKTTTLYVFVGGKGTDYTSSASQTSTTVVNGGWNGGGAGVRTSRYNSGGVDGRSFPRGGGGATDIATVTSALSYSNGRTTRDAASLLARCIVAGGGGGASACYVTTTTTTTSKEYVSASGWQNGSPNADGSIGASNTRLLTNIVTVNTSSTYKLSFNASTYKVAFARYDSSGAFKSTTGWNTSSGISVSFPYPKIRYYVARVDGGVISPSEASSINISMYRDVSSSSTSTSSRKSNQSQQGGGISGIGQARGTQTSGGLNDGAFGLGANQDVTNYRFCSGGGGGGWYGGGRNYSDNTSGAYIVDYTGGGSGFVNTAANASSRPSGYNGLQLDSGTTTAGNASHPSTGGGTETGHSGNGYARITVIE